MASKNRSSVTTSTSTTATSGSAIAPATARKKTRKPPVIDRIGINALAIAAPQAAAPAAPAPADPASTAGPAPAAPSGSASTSDSGAGGGPAPAPADTSGQQSGSTSPATPGGNGVDFPVNTPPQVTVPPVPAGFVPVNAIDMRGWRPMQSELASVPDAILELEDFPNYVALFGITAPPADQVSARLTVAAAWTTLFASTTAWYTYVKSQEGMAWKDALELVDQLKTPFQLAAASNPALLNQYPAIARMLAAKKVASKRAVSTRAKNKKAAQAASAQAAAPATAQPAGEPAAPAVPARVVTVQG